MPSENPVRRHRLIVTRLLVSKRMPSLEDSPLPERVLPAQSRVMRSDSMVRPTFGQMLVTTGSLRLSTVDRDSTSPQLQATRSDPVPPQSAAAAPPAPSNPRQTPADRTIFRMAFPQIWCFSRITTKRQVEIAAPINDLQGNFVAVSVEFVALSSLQSSRRNCVKTANAAGDNVSTRSPTP